MNSPTVFQQPKRDKSPARVPAASRRYLRHITYTIIRDGGMPACREKLDAPAAAAAAARAIIPDDGREHFVVLLLDAQNRLLGDHTVSVGSLSSSIVHPRETLGPCVREGVAHFIVCHNHPSGDPAPSPEDIRLTRQLAEGARLLGITFHDHVIVGNGSGDYVSLAQRGLV